ncbi:hypothetical protein U1Q18_032009 [Sarracenia purpurea var. burkii]
MAQSRRKVGFNDGDEGGREMSSIFLSAANDLSQLYAQTLNLHKIAFDAGRRHALAKVHQWVQLKLQDGKLVTVADIYAYLQEELNKNEATSELQLMRSSESQQIDGSTHATQDLEMEIKSEGPIH